MRFRAKHENDRNNCHRARQGRMYFPVAWKIAGILFVRRDAVEIRAVYGRRSATRLCDRAAITRLSSGDGVCPRRSLTHCRYQCKAESSEVPANVARRTLLRPYTSIHKKSYQPATTWTITLELARQQFYLVLSAIIRPNQRINYDRRTVTNFQELLTLSRYCVL